MCTFTATNVIGNRPTHTAINVSNKIIQTKTGIPFVT